MQCWTGAVNLKVRRSRHFYPVTHISWSYSSNFTCYNMCICPVFNKPLLLLVEIIALNYYLSAYFCLARLRFVSWWFYSILCKFSPELSICRMSRLIVLWSILSFSCMVPFSSPLLLPFRTMTPIINRCILVTCVDYRMCLCSGDRNCSVLHGDADESK